MINFFRLVLAAMTLAMVALISAVTTMHFAIHGAEVKVPDLQGLTIAGALRATSALGLNLGIENRYYSVDVPAGRVLAQSPLPGTIVRREWRMRVTESLGPQRAAIPDVVGQQERIAAIKIHRAGLELEQMVQMPYAGAAPGVVIAQNPEKGAAGVERPGISLLVSTAAPVSSPAFVMPQLIGMPFSTATALIAHAGLKLGPIDDEDLEAPSLIPGGPPGQASVGTERPSAPITSSAPAGLQPPAVPSGVVLSQSPSAGYRVDGSSVIKLTVSR